MRRFKRILFLSDGLANDAPAFGRALDLAMHNQAELSLLILHPGLPGSLENYRDAFEHFLKQQGEGLLSQAMEDTGLEELPEWLNFRIHIEGGHAPDILAIREVLREDHDLLVKTASGKNDRQGFMSVDMALLRSSPVPLWLWRDSTPGDEKGPVAVAIDPSDEGKAAHALAIRLLQVSSSLATMLGRKLVLLSCWDYPLESYLRNHPFGGAADSQIEDLARHEKSRLRLTLEQLIDEVGPETRPEIVHARGRPEELIPRNVAEHKVDILVMGTLARTGIPGFFIGNTAEDVLQRLTCSLFAMKPPGFVSPVRLDG